MKINQSKDSVSVLLVDDDEDDYLLVRELIKKIRHPIFKLDWESSTTAAKQRIAAEAHEIYLIDYRLGAENGLELLAEFDLPSRKQPFIILTGAGDSNIEEAAMNVGIADYLVKGTFDIELLGRVLRYSLQRKSVEQQRIEHMRQLNQAKDEFIGLASHQLRTPATAVKQYVGMLLEGYAGELSDQQRSFLQRAYTSNERQLKIVDDILKIAQLDMQKVIIRKEQIKVSDFVISVSEDVKPMLMDKNQKLIIDTPNPGLLCNVDSNFMSMALTNLLDNASKYSYPDSTITVEVQEIDTHMISISVADEGVGIEVADFEKLFNKFSRLPNPLSVEVGGSGLGLYWVREILLLHGGDISVKANPTKGVTFMLTMPKK